MACRFWSLLLHCQWTMAYIYSPRIQLELRTFQRAQSTELSDFLHSESVKIPHLCCALWRSIGCKNNTEILNVMSRCRSNAFQAVVISSTNVDSRSTQHCSLSTSPSCKGPGPIRNYSRQTNIGSVTAVLNRWDKTIKGEQTFANPR